MAALPGNGGADNGKSEKCAREHAHFNNICSSNAILNCFVKKERSVLFFTRFADVLKHFTKTDTWEGFYSSHSRSSAIV